MTHEAMRAQWEKSKAEAERLEREAAAARRIAAADEYTLLQLEGRGHTPHAMWLMSWLAGDSAGCNYWLDRCYPKQATVSRPATESEIAALAAEAEAMEATP